MKKKLYNSPLVEVNQLDVCELMAITGPGSVLPGPGAQSSGSGAPKYRTPVF